MLRSRTVALTAVAILWPTLASAAGVSQTCWTSRPLHPQWVDVRIVDMAPGRTRLGYRFYDRARKRHPDGGLGDNGLLDWMPLFKGGPTEWQTLEVVHPAGCRRLDIFVPAAAPGRRNPLTLDTWLLDGADGPDTRSRHTLQRCQALIHTARTGAAATDLVVVSGSHELARTRRANAGVVDPLLLANLPAAAVFDAATLPLQVAGTIWFFACWPRRC